MYFAATICCLRNTRPRPPQSICFFSILQKKIIKISVALLQVSSLIFIFEKLWPTETFTYLVISQILCITILKCHSSLIKAKTVLFWNSFFGRWSPSYIGRIVQLFVRDYFTDDRAKKPVFLYDATSLPVHFILCISSYAFHPRPPCTAWIVFVSTMAIWNLNFIGIAMRNRNYIHCDIFQKNRYVIRFYALNICSYIPITIDIKKLHL